jgi:hypothetical protein
MIYAPGYGFSFLHVPKCAGVAIEKTLKGIADFPRASFAADCPDLLPGNHADWSDRIVQHPELGEIHLAHVTLDVMRAHFPKTLDLILSSESFAVVREPRARFISALMQRLREFKGYGATGIEEADLKREAREVVDSLAGREALADLSFVHFTRQIGYLDLDGTRVVAHVFPIDNLDALWGWMRQRFGLDMLKVRQANASVQPKPALKALLRHAGPVYRAAVPRPLRRRVFDLSRKAGLMEKASTNYARIDLGRDIESFIADYYAADAEAHDAARARWTPALAS